ncbi:MAG: methyl-accepting chemotaxis protein, partial [Burkholderiales bacterium]
DDSVEKVEMGNKQASQAGTTMKEVVSSIQRVTDIMSEITAASHEQSIGIEQVNRAIGQMDETTQQNAALVEQAAAAAKSMQDQAGHLEQLVYRFRLLEGRDNRNSAPVIKLRNIKPETRTMPSKLGKPAAAKKLGSTSTQPNTWEKF